MNQADRDRIAAGNPEHAARGFVCAECKRAPSCPMLLDDVWARISPGWNPTCTCGHPGNQHDRISPPRGGRRRGACLSDPSSPCRCEGYCPEVADLLCLGCAERRLGRPLEVADLMPCLGNVVIYDLMSRELADLRDIAIVDFLPCERAP